MSEHQEKKATPKKKEVTKLGGCIAGALAGCAAVTFTNPIELVKTRMQLEGELSSTKGTAKVYRNPFQAFALVYKNEGLRGVQKGLIASYLYQTGLNSCRLGFYEPMRCWINSLVFPKRDPVQFQNMGVNVFVGVATGVIGSVVSSPFYLLKTRMQSFSEQVKIGSQSHYDSVWQGLKDIFQDEGVRGLFRGANAAILRTAVGSGAQLPAYFFAKQQLEKLGNLKDGLGMQLACSAFAGVGVTVVMNPFDVVLTRLYNQKGALYKGTVDCFVKTVRSEGLGALYKGFVAQLLRNTPHSILLLMFMEQTMSMVYSAEQKFGVGI